MGCVPITSRPASLSRPQPAAAGLSTLIAESGNYACVYRGISCTLAPTQRNKENGRKNVCTLISFNKLIFFNAFIINTGNFAFVFVCRGIAMFFGFLRMTMKRPAVKIYVLLFFNRCFFFSTLLSPIRETLYLCFDIAHFNFLGTP